MLIQMKRRRMQACAVKDRGLEDRVGRHRNEATGVEDALGKVHRFKGLLVFLWFNQGW